VFIRVHPWLISFLAHEIAFYISSGLGCSPVSALGQVSGFNSVKYIFAEKIVVAWGCGGGRLGVPFGRRKSAAPL